MVCKRCQENEILVKTRRLCRKCYTDSRLNGELGPKPLKTFDEKRETFVANLFEQYGVGVFNDLADLTGTRYTTLQSIGNKYGVTRELVRQWFQKIYRYKYKEAYQARLSEFKVGKTCVHHPLRKVADYNSGGWLKKGAIKEVEFYKKCREYKFDVRPCADPVIDQTVNGFKVEVKGTYTPPKAVVAAGSKTKYHRFSCSPKQLSAADFFACWHPTENCFFIIPNEYIPVRKSRGKDHGTHAWYISSKQSEYQTSKNRCWEFKDAWHLLLPASSDLARHRQNDSLGSNDSATRASAGGGLYHAVSPHTATTAAPRGITATVVRQASSDDL